MRALLGQLEPEPGACAANAHAAAAALDAAPSTELAVFGETFLAGYDLRRAAELAVDPGGPELAIVRAAAARNRTAVVIGFVERIDAQRVANAAACIDRDGSLAAVYRKVHLFGETERATFTPGDTLLVVTLAGRAVAPLVCFDIEFPEPARAARRAGAELLVTVAANMHPYGPDHALFARTRALENGLGHLYVNRPGHEAGLDFVGGSLAVDGRGTVHAQLGSEAVARECELPEPGGRNDDVDYLRHLRADVPVTRKDPQ
jgi:predicted amidohydrolase